MKKPGDIIAGIWVVLACAILIAGRLLIFLPAAILAVIFVGSGIACAFVADSINWLWNKITT